MEEEKIREMLRNQADSPAPEASAEDQLRTPVTILFSDIKGSTAYFERKGDLEGLAMLERHNRVLLPCIERNHGRLVKTIGDALMILFRDPVDSVRAAVGMQNALLEDGRTRPDSEQIHIRIGIHSGLGIIRDDDVFGDVVNAAAKVQSKSLPDQILITDSLVSAAETAGYQVGKLGRTKLKGKEEPIDVYTMGWSASSTQRLIDDLQTRFEEQLGDMRQARMTAEEEFDAARTEWRDERRRLHSEIERLEDGIRNALATARSQVTEEFRKQLQFELDASQKARYQAEADLRSAHERFETERMGYRAQIESLEERLVEALEQVNNPARITTEIRDQVEERLRREKEHWKLQWENERRYLTREIERLRKTNPVLDARQMVQERLRAKQAGGTAPRGSRSDLVEELTSERDVLQARVRALEAEIGTIQEATRREAYRELRSRYGQRSELAERVQAQLEHEIRTVKEEHAAQKESLSARIRQLEEAIPAAQESARLQTIAELQNEFETRLEEATRVQASLERRHADDAEEWALERRRLMKRLDTLESNLEEAREMAFKRSSEPTIEELNRLRHQLEEEFQEKRTAWYEERRRLMERLASLEDPASGNDPS